MTNFKNSFSYDCSDKLIRIEDCGTQRVNMIYDPGPVADQPIIIVANEQPNGKKIALPFKPENQSQ